MSIAQRILEKTQEKSEMGVPPKMSNDVFRMLRDYVKEVAKVDKEAAKKAKKLVTELEELDMSLDG